MVQKEKIMGNASGDGWNFQKSCAFCAMVGIICLHIGGESLRLKSTEAVNKHWHPEDRPINSYEGLRLMNVNTSASAIPSGEQRAGWGAGIVVDGLKFVIGD